MLLSSNSLISLIYLFVFSLFFRLLLEFLHQRWITTTAHTATIFVLPFVTFIITKVISGNIALSLGMIGALSIVRFRNPVRSPLELTVYFGAITMGITASVSLMWLKFFTFGIFSISIGLFIINVTFKKLLDRDFFTSSFSEGNALSTLDILVKNEINLLDNSKYLSSKNVEGETVNYVLISSNFQNLHDLSLTLNNNDSVIKYQLNR